MHRAVFEAVKRISGATVLHQAQNGGKGNALKAGFQKVLTDFAECTGIVTADADGQHDAEDIARVATALTEQPQKLILGARRPVPEMPFRSRFGNALTRHVFRAATGVMLADTQTGLRGIPKSLLPELLAVRGERYEYEMAMLLHLCSAGHSPVEVPIRTIYDAGNRSSHFRPVQDSAHVYKVLARHCLGRGLGRSHDQQKPLTREENIS